jgi:hypothetical protein
MRIIGAGMAGLLAARMLARHQPTVLERSSSLPHNHSAVLRFSTGKVAEVLGIPFKRVQLVKTVVPWRNPVADAMAYSHKVLGEYRSDRSVLLPERWQSSERYIAPEDLIEQMAEGVEIEFNQEYHFSPMPDKVISTVPMPVLAKAMGYKKDLGWKWIDGKNLVTRVKDCDAYVSVMVPDPNVPFSRATITGDQLIIELTGDVANPEKIIYKACELLGVRERIDSYRVIDQSYAKIAPIDEDERRAFIHWASTVTGRAYQLGRFATWRPRLLLDDLVHDVRKIERWITMPSGYEQDLELVKERRDGQLSDLSQR